MPTRYSPAALKLKGIGGPTSKPLTNLLHVTYEHPPYTPYAARIGSGGWKSSHVPLDRRIKWWNISPGDKVRIISGGKEIKKRHKLEVLEVDRERNQVFVKDGLVFTRRTKNEDGKFITNTIPKPVHYSKVQLWVGDFDFPPLPGETENRLLPVYATRLNTTAPAWDTDLGRYVWKRFAAATNPALPKRVDEDGQPIKLEIPWPVIEEKPIPECGLLDTPAEEALRITWVPPSPELNPGYHKKGEATPQDAYLTNPDPSQPIEHFLANELSNPHSRAKRTRRWQQRPIRRAERLARWIRREKRESAELDDGRTVKEIKAEATFKFERDEEERRKRRRRLQVQRTDKGKRIMRKMRKRIVHKTKKKARLRTIVLKPAPNQYIPPGMETLEVKRPARKGTQGTQKRVRRTS